MSHNRDNSPVRARKTEVAVEKITLEDQVVLWLGEPYRKPVLAYYGNTLDWSAWEGRFSDFMRSNKLSRRVERYPYFAVLGFFIDYTKRLNYGSLELQILLERLCGSPNVPLNRRVSSNREVMADLWPLMEKLELQDLFFWHHLSQAMNHRHSYVFWKLANSAEEPNQLAVRYHDVIQHCRQEDFAIWAAPSATDSALLWKYKTIGFSCNTEQSAAQKEGRAMLNEMNSLVSLNLEELLSSGSFQFPAMGGKNPYYVQLKKELGKVKGLVWNDDRLTVTLAKKDDQ
jgi:hypothetical protein